MFAKTLQGQAAPFAPAAAAAAAPTGEAARCGSASPAAADCLSILQPIRTLPRGWLLNLLTGCESILPWKAELKLWVHALLQPKEDPPTGFKANT